ncbi:MAG: NfeD family protein [Firmicutes bacterium]|nr:NfeD family protein [Bacillota bacterium]
MDMWMLWLIVIVLLTILEISTVNLVCVWFIVGALISLVMSFFIETFYIQFAVFVCLGLILMLITRPILIKKLVKKDVKTNLDRVIGMEAVVTEEITRFKIGEVKVDGKKWSATSDKKIEVGTTVIVESIDGVKLVVRKGEK